MELTASSRQYQDAIEKIKLNGDYKIPVGSKFSKQAFLMHFMAVRDSFGFSDMRPDLSSDTITLRPVDKKRKRVGSASLDDVRNGVAYLIGDAAKVLGVDKNTVRRWVEHGELECDFTEKGTSVFNAKVIHRLASKKKKARPCKSKKSAIFFSIDENLNISPSQIIDQCKIHGFSSSVAFQIRGKDIYGCLNQAVEMAIDGSAGMCIVDRATSLVMGEDGLRMLRGMLSANSCRLEVWL